MKNVHDMLFNNLEKLINTVMETTAIAGVTIIVKSNQYLMKE